MTEFVDECRGDHEFWSATNSIIWSWTACSNGSRCAGVWTASGQSAAGLHGDGIAQLAGRFGARAGLYEDINRIRKLFAGHGLEIYFGG